MLVNLGNQSIVVTEKGVVKVNGRRIKRLSDDEACHVRHIYKTRDYVIKIDAPNSYVYQCREEVRRWKKIIGTSDVKYFVPILASNTGWNDCLPNFIIQPRIKIVRVCNISPDIKRTIIRLIKKYGLCDIPLGGARNWTLSDTGEPLIYDYGI